MPRPADVLFGKIAVKNKVVDEGKIKECFDLLARGADNGGGLGKLLLSKGYITATQLRLIESHVQ